MLNNYTFKRDERIVPLNLTPYFFCTLRVFLLIINQLGYKMKTAFLGSTDYRVWTYKVGIVSSEKFYKNREKWTANTVTRIKSVSQEKSQSLSQSYSCPFHWVKKKKIPAHYFLVFESILHSAMENEILIFYPGTLPYYRHNTTHGA